MQPALSELDKATDKVAKRSLAGLESATPERMAKAGLENVEVGVASLTQRITDAPLDRLLVAELIGRREFDAGDDLRTCAWLSRIDPGAPSVDWNSVGGNFGPRDPTAFSSQATFDARRRWRRLEERFPRDSTLWQLLRAALVDEISFTQIGKQFFRRHDRKDAILAGQVGLATALGALADMLEMGHAR